MTTTVRGTASHAPSSAASGELAVAGAPRKRITGNVVAIYVGIVLVLLAFAFPLLYIVNTALKTQADFYTDPTGLTTTFDFGNFAAAWQQANFGQYLLNSVLYTLASAAIGSLASLLVAFPVARRMLRGSGAFNALFVVALFLPVALITQFQLLLRLGLYDTQLGYILLMAASVGIGPLLLVSYLRSVPVELDEAAAMDGAGYFRYLFTFITRLTAPALITAFILQALTVWNEIVLATVVFSDQGKFPASLGLRTFQGQYSSQFPLLAAATIIVAIPIIVLYASLQRFFQAGALNGAFKG